jgi:hypothetical protein
MSPDDPYAYAASDCQDVVAYVAHPAPQAAPTWRASPFAGAGYMTIVCAPHCDVFEDGAFVGPSPIIEMPAPPGEHRIELRGPGGVRSTVVVPVEPGRVTKKRVVLFGRRAAWRRHHRPESMPRDE